MSEDAYKPERDQQLEAMIQAGRLTEALTLLEGWYEQEPWNGEVLMRLAVVHWLVGEPARTLRDLDAFLAMEPDNAEALARRAQALLMLGKHEDAEATLAKAESIDPTTPGVLLNRALLHEDHGNYEQAIASLTAYLDKIPQDHLALARRSHLLRQTGHYTQALDDALACVKMHPEDPEAHFAEALAHVTMEQGQAALTACDRCLQLQKDFLPALRLKVDLMADLGHLPQAASALEKLRELDPDGPHTAMLQARIAAEQGDYNAALNWINRYLDDSPDEPYGYYRRGMIFFRRGEFEQALADFTEYAQLAPHALEAYEQQFLCLLELNRYEEAAKVGRLTVEMHPSNIRLQYNLAFADLLCGQRDDALARFSTALALDPFDEEVLLRIHLALSEHTPPEVRKAWFDDALAQHGTQSPMLVGLLAEVCLDTGDIERAYTLSQQVLAIDRDRPFGYLLGIKALCVLDRYPEALELSNIGVTALPQDGRMRLARGLIHRDMGQNAEALQDLEHARELLPHDAEVVRQQALTYGSMEKIPRAIHLLEEAVTLEPENAEGYFWLGYFLIHRKQYQKALRAADQMIALAPQATPAHLIRGIALRGLKRFREAEADLLRAQQDNPVLYDRLSSDPAIADIIGPARKSRFTDRMRRSITQGWQALFHAGS